jgi:hypothetical protein
MGRVWEYALASTVTWKVHFEMSQFQCFRAVLRPMPWVPRVPQVHSAE